MRTELTKQFVKKMVGRVLIFVFVMIIMTAIGQSISPVISNELAMTQMQNSNEMFVLMNTYNNVKPIINITYSCVILWFMYSLGRDTYKFAKTINNNEHKKEN